tara:strand:- start:107 stop:421 length:315 start_codon:yes stop_codon:yes gene_type:complete
MLVFLLLSERRKVTRANILATTHEHLDLLACLIQRFLAETMQLHTTLEVRHGAFQTQFPALHVIDESFELRQRLLEIERLPVVVRWGGYLQGLIRSHWKNLMVG